MFKIQNQLDSFICFEFWILVIGAYLEFGALNLVLKYLGHCLEIKN